MPTPYRLNTDALLTNPFGLALAAGRLKATIQDASGVHLTVTFKAWKRGVRGRTPIYDAERVYIEVPAQHGWNDKIGNLDLASGVFWQDGAADPYRVEQAMKILAVAQGQPTTDRVMHPGSCMICGRELTDPVSIERGIGPDCYENATGSVHQQKIKQPHPQGPVQPVEQTDERTHIRPFGNLIAIDFQSAYTRELLKEMKEVTDWRGRQYDPMTKQWTVSRIDANIAALTNLADRYNLTIDPTLRQEAIEVPVTPEVVIGVQTLDIIVNRKPIVETSITVKFDFGPNFSAILAAVKTTDERRFDAIGKQWLVKPTKDNALKLFELCKSYRHEVSDEAKDLLTPLRQEAQRDAQQAGLRVSLSKADDADLELDGFGFEPMPFQRAGIMYGDYANDRYMIADEQGLGKTIQALGRIAKKGAYPAVIVTPAAVKVKWARAVEKALPGRTVLVCEGQTPDATHADVYIINYDIVSYWKDHLMSRDPQALVLDESHYIKNPKAQRTVAINEMTAAIPSNGMVLLLTGTPVLNRPIELVEQLKVMGRLDDFGGFGRFVTDYIGWDEVPAGPKAGKKIPAANGAKNLTALNEKLRSLCYVRRLKRDVLSELPEKRREVVPMEVDWTEYKRLLAEIRERIRTGTSSGHAAHLAEIQLLRKAAVKAKMAAVKQWVTDYLETGEKLVLFAHHRDVQDELAREFGALRIAGGSDQSKKDRQAAMDRFQNDPNAQLVVCSMTAAREGIDLYAASNLAFVELGWNPGVHDQCEDRIHRIGQDRGTMMSYLLGEGTIDEEMSRLIEKKRKMKDAATEGGDVVDGPDDSMVGNLVKWLMED